MPRPFIIFNPAARGEKSKRFRQFLATKQGDSFALANTERPGDARQLAAEAVARGFQVIVAAGGDGTINEVINGIGLSKVALGVLPLGTMNVFARQLGIPRRVEQAWAVIEQGRTRIIDLARAEAGGKLRYFSQLAGVGLDAFAVRCASWELKKRIGPLSYIWAGLKTLSNAPVEVEVCTNGAGPCGRGAAVLIGNGVLYGGPFRMFPKARMDDGKLDVCVFHRCGYLDVLRYGQGALRGAHIGFRDVSYFQVEQFACSGVGAAAPFELDGEDAGETPVTFSVAPRALKVIVPRCEGGVDHA